MRVGEPEGLGPQGPGVGLRGLTQLFTPTAASQTATVLCAQGWLLLQAPQEGSDQGGRASGVPDEPL